MSGRNSRRTSNAGKLHRCQHYTVNAYVGAAALNTGSVVCPRIVAASTVHFGAGHPLNRTELLWPDQQGSMPDGSSIAPRSSIVSRRALLMSLLSALISARDFYPSTRSATCLHINTSSAYLSQVWNAYLPDWEQNGWPTRGDNVDEDDDEDEEDDGRSVVSNARSAIQQGARRPSGRSRLLSSAASIAPSVMSAQSHAGDGLLFDDGTDKMVDEDLLRKVAVFRRQFVAADAVGTVVLANVVPSQNPADRLSREAARGASLNVGTRLIAASPAATKQQQQQRRTANAVRRKSVPSPQAQTQPLPAKAEPVVVAPVPVAPIEPLRFVPRNAPASASASPNKLPMAQLLEEEPDMVASYNQRPLSRLSDFDDARSGYMTCDDDFGDARSRLGLEEETDDEDDESEYDDESDSMNQPPTPEDGSVLFGERSSSLTQHTSPAPPPPPQGPFESRVHHALHKMDPHGMVSKKVNVMLVDDAVVESDDLPTFEAAAAASPSLSSISRFFTLGRSPTASPILARNMPLHEVAPYRKASDASNLSALDDEFSAINATPAPVIKRRFSLFNFRNTSVRA